LLVGPWIPVQLNVTRPRRRDAMRRSMFHTILRNLEDIQLIVMDIRSDIDLFSLEVGIDDGPRNLMGIVRERAVYIDLSEREKGTITFAMERNYFDKINGDIASIDGVNVELIEQ